MINVVREYYAVTNSIQEPKLNFFPFPTKDDDGLIDITDSEVQYSE